MSSTGQRATWVRPAPSREDLQFDLILALGIALLMTLTALIYARTGLYDEPAAPWVSAIAIAFATLPLALRRKYPELVAVVIAAAFYAIGQFQVPEILMTNICLFLALYTVGAWSQNRKLAFWTRLGITGAMLVWIVVHVTVSAADPNAFPGFSRSGLFSAYATFAALQVITNLLYFGAAFLFGERAWRGARTAALLEAQGRELELERQTSAAQAVALDRIGIARELHDVVAHHVSVMGIQAAAARRLLVRDPSAAEAALVVVEESAHDAVTELRRLVHTLRTPETEDPSSTVGVAQLSALVHSAQNAGTPTSLIVAGEPRPLPILVDVALYRVVQEALTNVRKHAGRGASAEVRLRFTRDAAEVEISDDGVRQKLSGAGIDSNGSLTGLGSVADRANGSGLGLRGMRERMGAVGGTVSAGRREHGGFMVRASVPVTAVSSASSAAGSTSPVAVAGVSA